MAKNYHINNKYYNIGIDKLVVYSSPEEKHAIELFEKSSIKKDIEGIFYSIDNDFIKITKKFISIYNNKKELLSTFLNCSESLNSFKTLEDIKNITEVEEYKVNDKIIKINKDYLFIYKFDKLEDIYIFYKDEDFPNEDLEENEIYKKHRFYFNVEPVYDRLSFNYIHKDLDLFTKKNHTITIEGYFLGFFETKYFSFPNTTFLEVLLHLSCENITEFIEEEPEYYLKKFQVNHSIIKEFNGRKIILCYYLTQVGDSPAYITVYQN